MADIRSSCGWVPFRKNLRSSLLYHWGKCRRYTRLFPSRCLNVRKSCHPWSMTVSRSFVSDSLWPRRNAICSSLHHCCMCSTCTHPLSSICPGVWRSCGLPHRTVTFLQYFWNTGTNRFDICISVRLWSTTPLHFDIPCHQHGIRQFHRALCIRTSRNSCQGIRSHVSLLQQFCCCRIPSCKGGKHNDHPGLRFPAGWIHCPRDRACILFSCSTHRLLWRQLIFCRIAVVVRIAEDCKHIPRLSEVKQKLVKKLHIQVKNINIVYSISTRSTVPLTISERHCWMQIMLFINFS